MLGSSSFQRNRPYAASLCPPSVADGALCIPHQKAIFKRKLGLLLRSPRLMECTGDLQGPLAIFNSLPAMKWVKRSRLPAGVETCSLAVRRAGGKLLAAWPLRSGKKKQAQVVESAGVREAQLVTGWTIRVARRLIA